MPAGMEVRPLGVIKPLHEKPERQLEQLNSSFPPPPYILSVGPKRLNAFHSNISMHILPNYFPYIS